MKIGKNSDERCSSDSVRLGYCDTAIRTQTLDRRADERHKCLERGLERFCRERSVSVATANQFGFAQRLAYIKGVGPIYDLNVTPGEETTSTGALFFPYKERRAVKVPLFQSVQAEYQTPDGQRRTLFVTDPRESARFWIAEILLNGAVQWVPTDDVRLTKSRVDPNGPCVCGSGQKYKRCCGKA